MYSMLHELTNLAALCAVIFVTIRVSKFTECFKVFGDEQLK